MRVGIYHGNAADTNPGGKAVFAREMAAHLADEHEVTLYTARHGEGDTIDDAVDVVRFEPLDSRIARLALERATPLPADRFLALAGAVRAGVGDHVDEHVDVLLTHRVADDIVVSNLVDVPVIYQYHNVERVGVAARLRERFTGADAHLANSATVAREVAATFDRRVDGVVTPGVDVGTFAPDVEPAFEPDGDAVLFVGRVIAEKGVFDLLAAISRLDREVDCYVVGPGEIERLEATARDMGIGDAVTAVGPVPHDELPGYYAAATVVCNPTHYEGFGLVNLEAMACGAPLVTTRLPGVEEYATHDRDALLVGPGDVEGLAGALGALLDDDDRRERLARAAVETARDYSWEAQAAELADICSGVVQADAGAPVEPRRP